MSRAIELRHAAGCCRVELVDDLFAEPAPLLEALPRRSRLFLLTDPNVGRLWGDRFEELLRSDGREVRRVVVPAGEENKTLATVSAALDELLDAGIRRDDRVVALGGGVLGDQAGLAAALALRGVPCLQVPTTLLAMADSSVGGKVGVNHRSGKNLIGSFSQPERVILSPVFLSTLPERELNAGLQEAAKAAFLAGEAEIAAVERLPPAGERRPADLLGVVWSAVRLKARVVEADEREGGLRRILNLGHTLGHALEAATGYGRFLHGEAIGWGMLAAIELSVVAAGLDRGEADRFGRIVDSVGPRPGVADLPFRDLAPFLATDKKASSAEGLAWVLLEGAGRPLVRGGIDPREAEGAWEATRQRSGPRSGAPVS